MCSSVSAQAEQIATLTEAVKQQGRLIQQLTRKMDEIAAACRREGVGTVVIRLESFGYDKSGPPIGISSDATVSALGIQDPAKKCPLDYLEPIWSPRKSLQKLLAVRGSRIFSHFDRPSRLLSDMLFAFVGYLGFYGITWYYHLHLAQEVHTFFQGVTQQPSLGEM